MPQGLPTQGLGRAACCRVGRNCILASNDYTALDMLLGTRQYNLSAESSPYQTKLLRSINIHTPQHTIKNWSGRWRSAVSCISLMHGKVVGNTTFRTSGSSFFSKVPECADLEIKAISHSQANHRWCGMDPMILGPFDRIFELLCLKSLLSSLDCIGAKWA